MPEEISRVVNFFRVNFTRQDVIVSPEYIFNHINSLPYSEAGRYLPVTEDNFLSVVVDSATYPIKFRFGIVRKSGLPLIEQNGPPEPLPLAENAGLYEPTHAIIYSNGIMGAEYNHFGPRLTKLEYYLLEKFPRLVEEANVFPMLRSDIESEIARMGEVKMFQLKLNKDIIQLSRNLDRNVFDALNAMKSITHQIEDMEIIIRAKRKKSINLDTLKSRLPGWLNNSEVQGGLEKLKVKAIDNDLGGSKTFDLLQNYLRSDKRIIRQNPRYQCVDSISMYAGINEAYAELRPDIERILQAV
jgi:hypothetical protein